MAHTLLQTRWPTWRLSALPTHTSESRKCQVNTFKNSSHSPFEIRICLEKVSTSSSSVSISFIFLATIATLPHQQPPAGLMLKPMPQLPGSQHELALISAALRRHPTFPCSSPDSVSFAPVTLDLWRSAVPDSIRPAFSTVQAFSSLTWQQVLRLPEILVCHHVRC